MSRFITNLDSIENPSFLTFWSIKHFTNSLLLFVVLYTLYKYLLTSNVSNTAWIFVQIFVILFVINYIVFIQNENIKYNNRNAVNKFAAFLILLYLIFSKYLLKNNLINININILIIWFLIHTYYEYVTAGPKNWKLTKKDDPITDSYYNSVGDTIAGFFGCLLGIYLIKYGINYAIIITIIIVIFVELLQNNLSKKIRLNNLKS